MWEETRVFCTVTHSHVFTYPPHSLLSLLPLLLFLLHILHLLVSSSPTSSLVLLPVYPFLVLCHIVFLLFVFLLPFNPTFQPLLLIFPTFYSPSHISTYPPHFHILPAYNIAIAAATTTTTTTTILTHIPPSLIIIFFIFSI